MDINDFNNDGFSLILFFSVVIFLIIYDRTKIFAHRNRVVLFSPEILIKSSFILGISSYASLFGACIIVWLFYKNGSLNFAPPNWLTIATGLSFLVYFLTKVCTRNDNFIDRKLDKVDLEAVICRADIKLEKIHENCGEGGMVANYVRSYYHPGINEWVGVSKNDHFFKILKLQEALPNDDKDSIVELKDAIELTYSKSNPKNWYITIVEPINFDTLKITKK